MESVLDLPDVANKMKKSSSGLPVVKPPEKTEEAVDFISQFENVKDPSGGWNEERQKWFPHSSLEGGEDTLGYGTKLYAKKFSPEEVKNFYQKGISDEEAKLQVGRKVIKNRKKLEKHTGKNLDTFLTPNQKVAIESYIYNVGFNKKWEFAKNLKRAAEVSNPIERQAYLSRVQEEMDIVTAGGKVMSGLVKRRKAERERFEIQ